MTFSLPTIHLNGTGAHTLYKEYRHAYESLQTAIEALAAATCHQRDFYPQGPDAWDLAQMERREMILRLREAQDYIQQWRNHAHDHLLSSQHAA